MISLVIQHVLVIDYAICLLYEIRYSWLQLQWVMFLIIDYAICLSYEILLVTVTVRSFGLIIDYAINCLVLYEDNLDSF